MDACLPMLHLLLKLYTVYIKKKQMQHEYIYIHKKAILMS